MLNYDEARQIFIAELTRDAEAHEAGRYDEIGRAFERVDAQLPRGQGPEFDKLFISLDFWDGWIDARNHDWQYYNGISDRDWPTLARTIVKSLELHDDISDPLVLSHFDFRNRKPADGPIRRLIRRLRK